MQAGGFDIDIVVQGFPGKAVCHGGLGWSTIALVRGAGRVALVDVGAFNYRKLLVERLAARGLTPADVTDVLLTHSHYDHSINWVMFPNAKIHIGADELAWAVKEPFGRTVVPELYVRELAASPQLNRVRAGEQVLAGILAHDAPGHTPGHLIFVAAGGDRDVIFTGDSAKNRAELLSREADSSYDMAVTTRTIDLIWEFWRKRPGNIVVPGHDMPMVLDRGQARYIEERQAGVTAWFGDQLEETTLFEFTLVDPPRLRASAS
jgi:glyoxylase-like metal-dependent hydrolase (beta-lactamase superfamily II)